MNIEKVSLFSMEDECGKVEQVCEIRLVNDWINKYKKVESGSIVNIYTEDGEEIDVFTNYSLENCSLDGFYNACKEHAEESLSELLEV